jgi:hypothetical protein
MEDYTGRVQPNLEVYADPAMEGIYAVRVETNDPAFEHFLLTRSPRTSFQAVYDYDIEAVVLPSWPPKIRT